MTSREFCSNTNDETSSFPAVFVTATVAAAAPDFHKDVAPILREYTLAAITTTNDDFPSKHLRA